MFTTIITDCHKGNEANRVITRFNSLGLGPASLLGVSSNLGVNPTIEGGANLVDVLDASGGQRGVVFLNVAPRGNSRDGKNGTRFSYFYHGDTLVISTVKDYCLSFVREFSVAKTINIVELPDVLAFAVRAKLIETGLAKYIIDSQFRSFDFVPRLAKWLLDGKHIPSSFKPIDARMPHACVWCIDAFGNVKTTIDSQDLNLKPLGNVKTNLGRFTYYSRLKDVPFGETAIYTGSSGIFENRFLELATQGVPGSITKKLKIKLGDYIEIE